MDGWKGMYCIVREVEYEGERSMRGMEYGWIVYGVEIGETAEALGRWYRRTRTGAIGKGI